MQILFYTIVLLAVLYVIACLALFVLQRRILYSPKPAIELPKDIGWVEIKGNEITLRGRVINPKRPKALLYFGGNSEQIEQHAEFFSTLPDYTAYLVPYRGYGGNPGSPTEPDLYRDAELTYDSIAGDHESVSVIGRSLGSGVATYLGRNRRLDKLILVTPYDSMSKMAQQKYPAFPMHLILKDKYESWRRVSQIDVPTLILKADNDSMVPHERTDSLIAHFKPSIVTAITVPKTHHNDIYNSVLYKASISNFLGH